MTPGVMVERCPTCPGEKHGVRYDVQPDIECPDCGLKMHSDQMALATDLGTMNGLTLGDLCPRCWPGRKPKAGEDWGRMQTVAIRLLEGIVARSAARRIKEKPQ